MGDQTRLLASFIRTIGTISVGIIALSSVSAFAEAPPAGASGKVDAGLPKNAVLATVTVGAAPNAIAVSPDSTTVYIANADSNSVTVLDATQSTFPVKTTITAGGDPQFLAITPNGNTLYVSNGVTAGTVSVVSTTSDTVLATIGIGANPKGLAVTPNGKKLYVPYGENDEGAIAVVNTTTNQIEATVKCGGAPYLIGFTRDGERADVLNQAGSGFVQFVNTVSNKLLEAAGAGGVTFYPTGMTVSQSERRLYVTDQRNFVFEHGGDSGTLDRILSAVPSLFSAELLGQAALTPDGLYLYVPYSYDYNLNQADSRVVMLDVVDGTLIGQPIDVGNYPSWATVSPDGKTLYVSNAEAGTVSVVDIKP
jgi:YVTN family beta-propeller protein